MSEDRSDPISYFVSRNMSLRFNGAEVFYCIIHLFGFYFIFLSVLEHGIPSKIVHSIVPDCNMLSVFEVTEKSFHQVSEVVKDSQARLSVNGWYHGAPLPRTLKAPTNNLTAKLKPGFVEVILGLQTET